MGDRDLAKEAGTFHFENARSEANDSRQLLKPAAFTVVAGLPSLQTMTLLPVA